MNDFIVYSSSGYGPIQHHSPNHRWQNPTGGYPVCKCSETQSCLFKRLSVLDCRHFCVALNFVWVWRIGIYEQNCKFLTSVSCKDCVSCRFFTEGLNAALKGTVSRWVGVRSRSGAAVSSCAITREESSWQSVFRPLSYVQVHVGTRGVTFVKMSPCMNETVMVSLLPC